MRKFIALLLLICFTFPLAAKRERVKLKDIKEEIEALKKDIALLRADFSQAFEEIRRISEALRTFEQLNSELIRKIEKLQRTVLQLSNRLDQITLEVKRLQTSVPGETPVPQSTDQTAPTPQREEITPTVESIYRKAFADYLAGRYPKAIQEFRKIVQNYPDDSLADNAQYWIGECYYSMRNYTKAVVEFKKVVENYPEGDKAPDALFKIGYCYRAMGQRKKAIDVFEELINRYPYSDKARLARDILEEIRR